MCPLLDPLNLPFHWFCDRAHEKGWSYDRAVRVWNYLQLRAHNASRPTIH